jgi:SagB-type dehydrogenase family enzyme
MKKIILFIIVFTSLAASAFFVFSNGPDRKVLETIELPAPDTIGKVTLENTLAERRSRREWKDKTLTRKEISQLLWAAQGITDKDEGLRTAPSAGALYPLEVYVATSDGAYLYVPRGQKLDKISDKDLRAKLGELALGQKCVSTAPAVFIFSIVPERTTKKYGKRGRTYAVMEIGFAAENLLLEAVALGLGSVPVGAFDTSGVGKLLDMDLKKETPMLLVPVGHPK